MKQLKIEKLITVRETRSIELYLQEVEKIPMISIDEEVRLANLIKEGDEQALEKMVLANLRFVVSVAKKYQNKGLPLMDLINEGNIGLIKAAKRFEHERGFKFISYAVWWIRQSIMESLNESGKTIRIPNNKTAIYFKVRNMMDTFEQFNQREATAEEICDFFEASENEKDITLSHIKEAFLFNTRILSLDHPISEGGDSFFIDVIPNQEGNTALDKIEADSIKGKIGLLISQLPKKEAQVITKYFGIGTDQRSLETIGEEMNLTRERIRQVREKGIRRLKGLAAKYNTVLEFA